ncbi:hypothetical protein LguiB_014683 [Lonicera macranthoides]
MPYLVVKNRVSYFTKAIEFDPNSSILRVGLVVNHYVISTNVFWEYEVLKRMGHFNSKINEMSCVVDMVVTENDSVGYSGNQLLVPRFPVSGTRMKITQRAVYGKMEKMTKSRPVCAE